ncbi:MAG: DUF234 domain-containing protein [Pseudobutyrivibrio sp.]|nr:DUF234 domain-containing protein [Pseudobutyrivibrio sp.]
MFKFWYEFIPKATSVIELGHGEVYYTKAVKPKLHSFMGSVFEEMCRYYTLTKGVAGEYDCFVTTVGTWWGTEKYTDKNGDLKVQSSDIDVVALSEVDRKAIIGECKFKNDKIDKGVYETLVRRGQIIPGKYELSKYILFSLSGYTEWFDSLVGDDVLLLTLDEMYRE